MFTDHERLTFDFTIYKFKLFSVVYYKTVLIVTEKYISF